MWTRILGGGEILSDFLTHATETRIIIVMSGWLEHVPCVYVTFLEFKLLRRNPPDVGVTSGQKSCTKIIYIVLQTSVGLF